MNTKLLNTIERMHHAVKEGGLEIETNMGFIGPNGIEDTNGNVVHPNKNKTHEEAESIHDFLEQLFGEDIDGDELISPDELSNAIDEFTKKNVHAVGFLYDSIKKTTQEQNIQGNLYTVGHALTKIVEAMTHDMMDRLRVMESPQMAKYALSDTSTLNEIMPIISHLNQAKTKQEQMSAVNSYLILLAEQLMGVQTILTFFDKLATEMNNRQEEEDKNE